MKFNVAVLSILAATLAGSPIIASAADTPSGDASTSMPKKTHHHSTSKSKSTSSKSKKSTEGSMSSSSSSTGSATPPAPR